MASRADVICRISLSNCGVINVSNIQVLFEWLSGEFSNEKQAFEQAAFFANVRLWHRPLPHGLNGNPTIFAEQASSQSLDKPYRQRLFELKPTEDGQSIACLQYYACKSPQNWQGAATEPDRLRHLTLNDLDLLPGCQLIATWTGTRFQTHPFTDSRCSFEAEGKLRQVELGFEADEQCFLSHDRGVDPATGKYVWGALMGPYDYQKTQQY